MLYPPFIPFSLSDQYSSALSTHTARRPKKFKRPAHADTMDEIVQHREGDSSEHVVDDVTECLPGSGLGVVYFDQEGVIDVQKSLDGDTENDL